MTGPTGSRGRGGRVPQRELQVVGSEFACRRHARGARPGGAGRAPLARGPTPPRAKWLRGQNGSLLGQSLELLGPPLNYLGPLLNYVGPLLNYVGPHLNYLGSHLNYLGQLLNYNACVWYITNHYQPLLSAIISHYWGPCRSARRPRWTAAAGGGGRPGRAD